MSFLKSTLKRAHLINRTQKSLRDYAHRGIVSAIETHISRRRDYEILVVFGLRRSGNHLAIGWILDQVDGASVFFNNIRPNNPPYTGRMTEYRIKRTSSPRIILSYEDVTVEEMLQPALTSYLEDRIKRHNAKVRFAVILRDPYNLFASRIKKWPNQFINDAQIATQQAMYIEHAKLAETPAPIWKDAPVVPILFNKLLTDQSERDRTSDALNIRRGAQGLDRMSVYGHGSSFDGTDRASDAVAQDVFSRWHKQIGDPTFQAAIDDPRLGDIAQNLFSMQGPEIKN